MSTDPQWQAFMHELFEREAVDPPPLETIAEGYERVSAQWRTYRDGCAAELTGTEWVARRGRTVWLPADVMRNADGVLRERWFA